MKHAAALLLITLLAYLPALRAGWIWDDDYYVTKNYNLRSAEGLRNTWTKFGLRNGGTPQYYPVTHTTFWVEHQLWGLRPAGYHLVNVLLHACNAILLWLILKKLDVPSAWVAAAVFAVHPVHVESVAWVTERKNTLSALFYLGAMLVYLEGVGCRVWGVGKDDAPDSLPLHPKPYTLNPKLYTLSLVLFVCALLSKSVTASLPAAILLIIWWKRGRITLRDVAPLIPMFILGVAMGTLTSWMEREHVGAQGAEWELSIWQRVLIAGRAVWFYAMKLAAPVNLAFIYPRWRVDPARLWQWVFPLAAIALVAGAWAMSRWGRGRWGRGALAAILFFGGTLLPALGFVPILPMRYSFVADHFQYLASIGLIVLICAALATWLGEQRFKIIAAVWIVGLGVLTFRQTFIYANLETLWHDTIAKNPTGWMPRTNLAKLRIAAKDYDGAETLLVEALKHNPEQAEVLVNLGVIAEQRGRRAEAMELYRRALASRPSGVALVNLGRLLLLEPGREAEAAALFEQAAAVEPTYAPAHLYIGLTRAGQGDLAGAAEAWRRATRLDPGSAEAWNNLGAALENLGDRAGAIDAYQRALEADPNFEKAQRNLHRATGQ